MLVSSRAGRCAECHGEMMDSEGELVCGSCGVVAERQTLETMPGRALRVSDFTSRSLGGFMGPPEDRSPGAHQRGPMGSMKNLRYLKTVSDFAGKEETTLQNTLEMVERVSEKLNLPRIVAVQAAVLAKRLFALKGQHTEVTAGALSAYSIITACRIEGVVSTGVKEVVEAHRDLGRRVKISALIELWICSPVKTRPRRAEEYVGRVMARLPSVRGVSDALREEDVNEVEFLQSVRAAALDALEVAGESTGGHSPCALAATATYAADVALAKASGRRRYLTQRAVAEAVDVAEYTVREQYGGVFRPVMAALEERISKRLGQSAPA